MKTYPISPASADIATDIVVLILTGPRRNDIIALIERIEDLPAMQRAELKRQLKGYANVLRAAFSEMFREN